jgi:hypothetical protein
MEIIIDLLGYGFICAVLMAVAWAFTVLLSKGFKALSENDD